jgi:hypothetical protein
MYMQNITNMHRYLFYYWQQDPISLHAIHISHTNPWTQAADYVVRHIFQTHSYLDSPPPPSSYHHHIVVVVVFLHKKIKLNTYTIMHQLSKVYVVN